MSIKRTAIVVNVGVVDAIVNELGVSRSAFYNALNFGSNSESAQRIRDVALKTYGGILTKKIVW